MTRFGMILLFAVFASASAADQVVSEFAGKCARFVFVPDLKKSKLTNMVQQANRYVVYRKAESEAAFKEIFAMNYLTSAERVAEFLGILPDQPKKDVQGYEIYSSRFGVRDYVKRTSLAMLFSIFNPRGARVLGNGYEDCEVDPGKSYEYYIGYTGGPQEARFPDSAVKIQFQTFTMTPPEIQKIVPREEAAEIHLAIDKAAEKKSGGVTLGYNVFRRKDDKVEKINISPLIHTNKKPELTVEVKNLKKGERYFFYTTVVSFSNKESAPGPETEFMARSFAAPEQVQKVEVKAVNNGFEISWVKHSNPDVIGYHVYEAKGKKSGNPQDKFKRINAVLLPPEKTSYTHFIKAESKRYSYRVTAVNQSGNESAMSAAGFMTYKDMENPDAPEINELKVAKKGIEIKWDYKSKKEVRGFMLYRSSNTKDDAIPLDIKIKQGERSCVDKTAQSGGTYWYSLRAMGPTRVMSAYSSPKKFTLPEVGINEPPHSFSYNETPEGILLHWKPTKMVGSGYNIYRSVGKAAKQLLNPEPISLNTTRFVDANSKRGEQPIYYHLVVMDADRQEKSKPIKLEVPTMQIQLITPDVKIVKNQSGLSFIWPGDTDKKLAVYELYRKSSRDKDFKKIGQSNGEQGSIQDKKPPKGEMEYYIRKKSPYASQAVVSKVIKIGQ
jgi:fibronectin type 3 domain-containing protein